MISSKKSFPLYQPYLDTIVGLSLNVMFISSKGQRLSGDHDGIDGA